MVTGVPGLGPRALVRRLWAGVHELNESRHVHCSVWFSRLTPWQSLAARSAVECIAWFGGFFAGSGHSAQSSEHGRRSVVRHILCAVGATIKSSLLDSRLDAIHDGFPIIPSDQFIAVANQDASEFVSLSVVFAGDPEALLVAIAPLQHASADANLDPDALCLLLLHHHAFRATHCVSFVKIAIAYLVKLRCEPTDDIKLDVRIVYGTTVARNSL
jgi:hypothetical protein